MPRSYYKPEYFYNPVIDKPIEEIYQDYHQFSAEIFPDESNLYGSIDFMVPLPPTFFEGKFVKGLFLSQGTDALNRLLPEVAEMFVSMAYTMTPAYSWCNTADAFLTLYDNPQRHEWYRTTFPHLMDKPFIPLQDADFLSEYDYIPAMAKIEKDIDLIAVARMHDLKNVPFLGKVLKLYREKYPQKPIRMTLVTGKDYDLNLDGLNAHEASEYKQLEAILGTPTDYIDFVPLAHWHQELPMLYARSKICLLAALIEGKNRSIQEAMCCNTAVICNEEYNQYVKGNTKIIPEGAGLYAYYDPESWVDAIHQILENYDDFKPRHKFMELYGRRRFLNTCIDHIPYFRENLPNYEPGRHDSNRWLDMAVHHNYGISLQDFLYGKRHWMTHIRGVDSIKEALKRYMEALDVPSQRHLLSAQMGRSAWSGFETQMAEDLTRKDSGYEFEYRYWDAVLGMNLGENQENIMDRLTPERTFQVFPKDLLKYIQDMRAQHPHYTPKVLDVGCGPVSMLAYGAQEKLIELVALDPLADRYRQAMDKYGYQTHVHMLKGFGEELVQIFGENIFDFVWACNSIDHSFAPEVVLDQMVRVTKPGGHIFLKGWTREGSFENWNGLHQHDIHLNGNYELICESKERDSAVKTLKVMNRDLPIDIVFASTPSAEIKHLIELIWRKKV